MKDIFEESRTKSLIVILIRHRGCTFCRESLAELAKYKQEIFKLKWSPVVVHMGEPESSHLMQSEFGLEEIPFVADSEKLIYKKLGARRGGLNEVIGPKVILDAVVGGALLRRGMGRIEGDSLQLGGVYLLEPGKEPRCLHQPKASSDVESWSNIISQLKAEGGF